jgi:excisionase family DNA binding protein
MGEPEKLNGLEHVSERLAVSKFTVARMVKGGHLRAVRVGKRVLIPESELERVMREGCGKHAAH